MTVPSFTRARIERLCADALERAGVAGVLPTPLDAVAEAVGVRERVALPPGARVLGAAALHRGARDRAPAVSLAPGGGATRHRG
jgi:hypothetical protein